MDLFNRRINIAFFVIICGLTTGLTFPNRKVCKLYFYNYRNSLILLKLSQSKSSVFVFLADPLCSGCKSTLLSELSMLNRVDKFVVYKNTPTVESKVMKRYEMLNSNMGVKEVYFVKGRYSEIFDQQDSGLINFEECIHFPFILVHNPKHRILKLVNYNQLFDGVKIKTETLTLLTDSLLN